MGDPRVEMKILATVAVGPDLAPKFHKIKTADIIAGVFGGKPIPSKDGNIVGPTNNDYTGGLVASFPTKITKTIGIT